MGEGFFFDYSISNLIWKFYIYFFLISFVLSSDNTFFFEKIIIIFVIFILVNKNTKYGY